jgi:hypothetical protein
MRARVEGSRGCLSRHAASGSFLKRLSPKPHFSSPVFSQVLPARIDLLDESDFLFAPPAFQLLFPIDGRLGVIVGFVVHEAMNFVLAGKSLDGIHFVLRYAAVKIAGDTDIKGAGPADQDVDPELVVETVAHGGEC